MPEDESDLAYRWQIWPREIPVTVIGLGSNLIVRDGGIEGVVIRLGRGFNEIKVEPGHRVRAGAAAPDLRVAKAAQDAAITGLAFLSGIPGAIGGALRMNGGAYGGETKDILVEARGVDRAGNVRTYSECRHGLHLSPLRRARGRDLHRSAVCRARPATRRTSAPRWRASRRRAPRRSRAISPAARRSKIRTATRRGS